MSVKKVNMSSFVLNIGEVIERLLGNATSWNAGFFKSSKKRGGGKKVVNVFSCRIGHRTVYKPQVE